MSKFLDHKRRDKRRDSDSDSECEREREEMEMKLFKKFKKMLLCDHELMVAGSNAYANIYNTEAQAIPVNGILTFEFNETLVNFDHLPNTGELVVKSDGIYYGTFYLNVNDPSQWSLFVNGIPQTAATVGTNAGATNFTTFHIVELHAGDVLTTRNYISPKDVILTTNAGGTGAIAGTNAEIIFIKIAPLPRCQKP